MTKWEWEQFRDETLKWIEDDEHRANREERARDWGTGPLKYVLSLYYNNQEHLRRSEDYLEKAAEEYFVPALLDEIQIACEQAKEASNAANESGLESDYETTIKICNKGFWWLKKYFESPKNNNDEFSFFSARYFDAGSREEGSIEYGRESLLELGNPVRIREYTLRLQFYKGNALFVLGYIKDAIELIEGSKEEDIDIKALLAMCYWYGGDARQAYFIAKEVLRALDVDQCNRLRGMHFIIAKTYRLYPEVAGIPTRQGGMEEAHHFISRLVSRDDEVGEWAREEIKKYQKNQYGSYIYVE